MFNKLFFYIVFGIFAVTATAKTFVLPHVLESSGKITNTLHAFDTDIFMVYGGTTDSAAVDVYIYDGQTGDVLKSATGTDVCNPCTRSLRASGPRQSVSLETEILARGGFPGGAVGPLEAFAVAVVSGDTDQVAISAEILYANENAFDLSLTHLNAQYIRESLTLPSLGKRVFVLPHVLESSGKASTTGSSFDTDLFITYTAGLAGSSSSGSGATGDLYLYDNSGAPMLSATAAEVCNPCTVDLSGTARMHKWR
jgi:hypothetical protein